MWQTKKDKLLKIQRQRKTRNRHRRKRKADERSLLEKVSDAQMIRKFASAKTGRLVDDWKAGSESINSDIKNSIDRVRQRSKDLSLNNDYARKYLKLFRKNVVGDQGFRLKSLVRTNAGTLDENAIDIIQAGWKDFCKKDNFSASGELSYFKFMTMFASQYPTDGEFICRYAYNDQYKYGFAIESIDPRLLDHELNLVGKNGRFIRLGIEFDSMGRRIQYYFKKQGSPRPDEYNFNSKNYNIISASEIIHIYDKEDCTQVRGYPLTQIALLKSHNIGAYEESELIAARVGSSNMGFFTQNAEGSDGYQGDIQTDGSIIKEAEAGTFEILPAGMGFEKFDPNHPNGNMPEFVKNQLRGIASGLDVSYNTLASDGEGINFSTMRSFALDDRDGWKMIQKMVIEDLLTPICEKYIEMALLTQNLGSLPMRKLTALKVHEFIARTFSWVDPLKDMQAYALGIQLGIYSRTRVCQETGLDFKEVMEELKKEEELAGNINISGANTNISLQEEMSDDATD